MYAKLYKENVAYVKAWINIFLLAYAIGVKTNKYNF